MEDKSLKIEIQKPVAYLHHEATKSVIPVYKPINWLQRKAIKWLFGLVYKKVEHGKNDF